MSATLYDLSSLPSTLSLISPAARRRQQTGDSVSLLQPEETQEKLKKCDKTEQNISSPTEKNILSTKNNSVKDKNFLRRLTRVSDEEDVMFCSPFRRRRRRRVEEGEERQLTREEAWHLYLAKLEEEANYFSVSDREEEPDICTCHTCVASYEMLYSQYLEGEDNTGDQSTVEVMQAILNVNNTKKSCQIM